MLSWKRMTCNYVMEICFMQKKRSTQILAEETTEISSRLWMTLNFIAADLSQVVFGNT
jgi:hypothetical protein